jgi:hypothetical protein
MGTGGGASGRAGFSTVLSFFLTNERFRPEWDWQKIKELRRFGIWVFISSCITFILIRAAMWCLVISCRSRYWACIAWRMNYLISPL